MAEMAVVSVARKRRPPSPARVHNEKVLLHVPWWQDVVEGIEKPIINKGFITVPDKLK